MEKQSLGKLIVLSIITLGIYALFWYISTAKHMRQKGQNVANNWYLFAPIVVALALIVPMIIISVNGAANSGESFGLMAMFYLLFIVAGFASLYWYWTFCVAGEAITGGTVNRWIAVILAWFVSPIVTMLWFQYEFNRLATADDLSSSHPTPAPGEDLSTAQPTPQPETTDTKPSDEF